METLDNRLIRKYDRSAKPNRLRYEDMSTTYDAIHCTVLAESPISWNVLAWGNSYFVSDTHSKLTQWVARGELAVVGNTNTCANIVPLCRAEGNVATFMLLQWSHNPIIIGRDVTGARHYKTEAKQFETKAEAKT